VKPPVVLVVRVPVVHSSVDRRVASVAQGFQGALSALSAGVLIWFS
jgi:hypothetical protein